MDSASAMMKNNVTSSGTNESMRIDCFSPYMIITNGIWLGDDPLNYSLPLFLVQLLIITLTTRALHALVKPLGQPMVVAEILAGMLLGPSVAGKFSPGFLTRLFPPRSVGTLSSMANVGLLYFVFMVGVEMDINVLRRVKRKVAAIGTLSIAVPFAITLAVAYALRGYLIEDGKNGSFYIYLAIALSVTSFPLLARVLTELKLLSTEIGRVSLLSSVVNDLLSWVLLAVVMTLTGNGMQSHYVLLFSVGFVLVCVFLVQPVLKWLVGKTPEGAAMSDVDLGVVIMGVMVAGFVADSIGIHCTFGAFVYGLVFPHGSHGTALVERLEHFVMCFLMPVYFGKSGFKTDIWTIKHSDVIAVLTFTFILSSVAKVVTTTLLSVYLGMPVADGLSIGFLMNSQGLAEVILLNIARDTDLIEPETFAIMEVMSVLMTALMTPLVKAASKPTRQLAKYKRRTVMHGKPNAELRMLACVHSTSNASSIINLLDMSTPTKQSPVSISALHLVELTGRESAMLIVHDTSSTSSVVGESSTNIGESFCRNQAQTERIVSAFENYQQRASASGVSVQALTVVAPYSSMHDHICTVAAENRAAIIVLPFDGSQTVKGIIESDNLSIRAVNQNVLHRAPCSVAILVDRGLNGGGKAGTRNIGHYDAQRVVVLFIGGPDDREALSIASRMAQHTSVTITLVRFVSGANIAKRSSQPQPPNEFETSQLRRQSRAINMRNLDADPDQVLDEECISEFNLRNMGNKPVEYVERVANSSEEMVATIKSMNCTHDLYVVGRSHRRSQLTEGLIEWAEYPELGPIGDLLASSDIDEMLSVLVVQQYTGAGFAGRDDDGCDEADAMVEPNAPQNSLHKSKCAGSANLGVGDEMRYCQRGA